MNDRIDGLIEKFQYLYGMEGGEIRVFAAPGRVNLIGEHIDYCGGHVFPAALTLDTVVVVRSRKDRKLRMTATDLPGIVDVSLDNLLAARDLRWGNYQAGVADELAKAGYKLTGLDMLYESTVPFGAGLSSSASIETVTALALVVMGKEAFSLNSEPDLVEMALIGQRAENNFCSVSCGIMDQFASAMGKKDHAILLNCSTLEYKYAPLSLEEYKIVIADTAKKRSLAESKYNERTREVTEAFSILKTFLPGKNNLCDVSVEEFIKYKSKIDDIVIRKRAEHIVYENDRVLKSYDALMKNDVNRFGSLLFEAHASIRDLYEATGPELDTMFEEAIKVDGVIGARMTGAGFGGCTVNIVRDGKIKDFIYQVGENYYRKTGLKPAFYIAQTGDGAREININC